MKKIFGGKPDIPLLWIRKISNQDAFQLYVKDVNRAELLDRKQESALAKKIESNRQKLNGFFSIKTSF